MAGFPCGKFKAEKESAEEKKTERRGNGSRDFLELKGVINKIITMN